MQVEIMARAWNELPESGSAFGDSAVGW